MKLTIDTDKAAAARQDELDAKASALVNLLGTRLDSLDEAGQDALFESLQAVMASNDSTAAVAAGTFAQNAAGTAPAQALGAGSGQPYPANITADQALQVLQQHLGQGEQMLLRRLTLPPGSNSRIDVDPQGDDVRIGRLRQQLTDKEAETTTLRGTLTRIMLDQGLTAPAGNSAFPNDAAQQVAQVVQDKVSAAGATPADHVAKATITPLVNAIETAAGNLSSSMVSSQIAGKVELDQAVTAAKTAVS